MADDVTLKILERVAAGPLPMHTADAKAIASLERFKELESSGLIEAAVIRGSQGDVVKVQVAGITHFGRAELETLKQAKKAKSPVTKSLKLVEKLFWLLVGVGMTLLGLWLAKQLGLK